MNSHLHIHHYHRLDQETLIVKKGLTEDVHHGEAVVEGEAKEEPADGELPEVAGEDGRQARDEADEIRPDESGYAAVTIGHPAEYHAAEDRPDEEDALGDGRQRRVVAHPFQL